MRSFRSFFSQARRYATFPYPPEYDWKKEFPAKSLPTVHEFVLGQSSMPKGITFSVLNPKFLAISIPELAELYRRIGTLEFSHPVQRHYQQLIIFTPERRALHSLAAHLSTSVCIYDDKYFSGLCERLYPDVMKAYHDKQILLAHEAEKCKEEARRFIHQYLYRYDDTNLSHRWARLVEYEMLAREDKKSGKLDLDALYKAMIVLVQNKIYEDKIYSHVDSAVLNVINERLINCDVTQIPDDIRDSEHLWALPVKPGNERSNHIIAGGPATGKSTSASIFSERQKKITGKPGTMITATLNTDRKRVLIKLEDTLLSGQDVKANMPFISQSWSTLSHMEASIMTTMAMGIIHDRLQKEGRAPDVIHETTFPDDDVVKLHTIKGARLSLFMTSYSPANAVDGNIMRYHDTGRLEPVYVVLGAQKRAAQMLCNLVRNHKDKDIIIEHHDTEGMVHRPRSSDKSIGKIRLSDNTYQIYSIKKTLELIKSRHITETATHRFQIFSNERHIGPESLAAQFVEEYGHMNLAFMCGDHSGQAAYAGFTRANGLEVYDEAILASVESQCQYAQKLFNHLRELTPALHKERIAP